MKTLTELTGDTEVTSWIPADYYADLILEASVCYGQLSGVITAVDYDAAQGSGGIVQVRYVPARTAQGPLGMCGCLTTTSSTLGTYSITIAPYGDMDTLCGFSLWKAKGPVKDKILNEMAKGLAHKRDEDIWSAITTGFTPTYTFTSQVTVTCGSPLYSSCCSLKVDLYNGIVNLKKQMEGGALHPDYVIMSPTVAAYLYYKDDGSTPLYLANPPMLKYGSNGNLIEIAGLKVIESCVASACTANGTSVPTMAVVIDSSRAVGEAWGKRPTFEEERVPYCDKYEEVIWMYWGCHNLDTTAIGHLLNAT